MMATTKHLLVPLVALEPAQDGAREKGASCCAKKLTTAAVATPAASEVAKK